MSGLRRFGGRALVASLLATAAVAGWVTWTGRIPVRDVLPARALLMAEAHDAARLVERIEGTRFAAAFAKSDTRTWLEGTEAVRSLDAALAEGSRLLHWRLGRRHLLDFIGGEAAIAWYAPAAAPGTPPPWVAGCRLSWRAWVLVSGARLAGRFFPAAGVTRTRAGDIVVSSVPAGTGGSWHFLLRGRLLVAGTDGELVRQAGLCLDRQGTPLTGEVTWRSVRDRLPASGELFVFASERAFTDLQIARPRDLGGAAGMLVRATSRPEIHVFAETASERGQQMTGRNPAEPPPALSLLDRDPLFFYADRRTLPPAVAELLASRRRDVARRGGPGAPSAAAWPAFATPGGFALALTEGATDSLLPQPRGCAVLDMGSAPSARAALASLYPPGARSTSVGGIDALSTRESLPLSGTFELFGAAIGPRLVLATGPDLLAACGREERRGTGKMRPADPGWPVDAVSALSIEKALPLLRRYAPTLSGLLAARYRAAPDPARDIDLLAAVRSVTVSAGSTAEGTRALISLDLRDL